MHGVGKVSLVGLLVLSAVVQDAPSKTMSDQASLFKSSLLAVTSSDLLQRDTHTVMLTFSGNKGYVKFYPVSSEGVIRVNVQRKTSTSSWYSTSVVANPDIETVGGVEGKLNPTKIFADALSHLKSEPWLAKDKFRLTVVSADNTDYVLYRVSVEPYYEWNSVYLKVAPDGSIKDRWAGY